jgi:flagellar assembly protein FliH
MSDASRWRLPDVRGPVVAPRGRAQSAAALVEAERETWRQGFERGRAEGRAAVEAAHAAQVARLDELAERFASLCDQLARPIEPLDDEVAHQLARLALQVGAQLARRELVTAPSQVIAIIREAVGLLPVGAREVRIYVHPADGAAIRERLAEGTGERAWTLLDDPVMTRGGCRVATEHSSVDARLESRLATIVAAVLGEERLGDRTTSTPEGGDE